MTPEDLQAMIEDPPTDANDIILDRIQGSMVAMALGDALGAHVEFRPRQYLIENPVLDLEGGGTWGLKKGQVFIKIFIRWMISGLNPPTSRLRTRPPQFDCLPND